MTPEDMDTDARKSWELAIAAKRKDLEEIREWSERWNKMIRNTSGLNMPAKVGRK